MNPREQWKAFYEHRYTNNAIPPIASLLVVDAPMGIPDRPPSLAEKGTDWFGVEWVKDGSIGVVIPDPTAKLVLDEIGEWREKIVWPDLEAIDWEAAARLDNIQDIDRENQFFYMGVTSGAFERLHYLLGFENALVSLLTEPDECEAFFAVWQEWRLRLLEKVKQYWQPDVIMYHDDAGTQIDMFYSPEIWRRLFKPLLKGACDKCHELGIFFEYHSCGKIERIVPELVEIGADAWQGQEINDILALKKLTANKLAYHPFPDYQALVARANTITEAEVRAITREKFIKNLEGGQYAPLMYPMGDWVTDVIMDEIHSKLGIEFVGDPVD